MLQKLFSIFMRRTQLIINSIIKGDFAGLVNMANNLLGVLLEPIKPNYQPMLLIIEPTNRCNLRCTTCINKDFPGSGTNLALEDYISILDKSRRVRKIGLTGIGEPLMHPQLVEMVAIAKRRGIHVGFTSNATLLTKKKGEELLEAGLDWISFSVDSPVEVTYEKIRAGAKFVPVIHNIKTFIDSGGKRLNPNILVVVTEDNLLELPLFIPLLNSIGISRLDLQTTHNWGSGDYAKQINEIKLKTEINQINFLRKFIADSKKAGITCSFMNLPDHNKGRQCKWPWRATYISNNGLVTPCCLGGADPRNLNFGNILTSSSIASIWKNQDYQQFRRDLKSTKPPAICRGCPNYFGFRTI